MINKIIKDTVDKQRDFFNTGKSKDIHFRIQHLYKLKEEICRNENKIFDALKKDLHKHHIESYVCEVGLAISEIDYMIKNINKLAKPIKVKTPPAYFGGKSYIIPEPYGVSLIMGPWNYPFQLIVSPLIGAIAAGNCAVIKPSELSPSVSLVLHDVISKAFGREYAAVIEGGIHETEVLLQEKFDYIFFTGGTAVGKIVMQAAARNLTPVTLELGGKSPCIVDEDVNIEYTARRIVWGKFMNCGQTCVAPDYLLIHKNIKDKLLCTMKSIITEFYTDHPEKSEHYGRIINSRHFERLTKLLESGCIIHGGQSDQKELFIEPTIIENPGMDSPLMQDEIFGPILPVFEYVELEEVTKIINNRPKPLALYFFSRDHRKQQDVLRKTSSGGVSINDTISHITTKYLPFGGVGESGMGTYHGKASFDTFSHRKSVLKNTFLFDVRSKYPPYLLPLEKVKKILKLV